MGSTFAGRREPTQRQGPKIPAVIVVLGDEPR